jgi:hypothetical protein
MKTVKSLALLVLVGMLANLVHVVLESGMNHGVGMDTFLAGASDPWQLFINCDLVAGLLLTVAWIAFRERGSGRLQTVAWIWMALWWGNVVVAAYVLRAAHESRGDWPLFFMGRNAPGAALRQPTPAKPLPVRVLSLLLAAVTTICVLAGIRATGFAPLPTFGYVAGFAPIVLTLLLLGLDRRTSVLGRPLSRTA